MGKDQPDPAEGDVQRVPFAAFLQDLRGGVVHANLTTAMADLVDAVTALDSAGELRLTLKVKPEGRQVLVTEVITVKAPEAKPVSSIYFVDEVNNLVRDDPMQPRLPLREVPRPDRGDVKEAKSQ